MPVTRNQSAFSQGNKPNLGQTQPSASTESSEPSEEGASAEASRRDSPDNCSICLGPFNNKSFTSSCAHSFCFVCLKQWSKVKAECPLCKQPFTSIFHSVRSNDNYEIFYLPARNVPPPIDYNLYDLVGGNFRAMTVPYLTLPPSLDADLTLSNFSRFQFRHRRFLGQHHHHGQHPVHGEHQYSYTGVPVNPATHVNGETWPRGAEEFRREVYHRRMGPPVVVLGTENSTYRLTPAMVAASAHRMERIMPWLTRELRVLLHGHQSLRLAISVIQPLLTQFSLDSEEFLNRVTPLLGRRSQAFMQQFIAYANSALPMQVYDRRAMYQRQDYSNLLPGDSSGSSSSDDDVVEITSISSASNNNTANNNNNNNASSTSRESRAAGTFGSRMSSTNRLGGSLLSGLLSEHGWDSPIPGPSWETLNVVDDDDDDVQIQEDPVSVSSETDDPVYRPDARNADSDASKAGSDLVFLKYDKPWNERSPINLSSSSEAEEPTDHSKKRKKSKHKKKNKDMESKSHKPSLKIKIRRKHKARRSKDNEEDDYEVGSDSSDDDNRRTSQSIGSGDRSTGKRHKKSKDRSKKSSRRATERTSDRELVDRLFAEAISQSDITSIFQDEPSTAALQADSVENRQPSGKSKEKRKKKRKNSSSPSTSRAYKKHHSGHKKSTDPNRNSHAQRHLSRDVAAAGHVAQETVSAASAVTSMSPSAQRPGAFQPSFLPIPDTVQHIPLNLWVSTWPALSVSTHAFSSGPPPTATAVPHALNLSSSRPSGLGLPPRTISSSSSTDNASEDEQEPRGNTGLNVSGSHKRTKKWVESNFLTSRASTEMEKKLEAGTSTSQTIRHAETSASVDQSTKNPRNFTTDFLLNTDTSKPSSSVLGGASTSASASCAMKQMIEVVCSSEDEQNGSGDDVLVCSSGSDTTSEYDEGKKNQQTDVIRQTHQNEGSTTKDSNIYTPAQNLSTLTTEATSSRLIAYDQACSKTRRQAVLPPESAVLTNTSINSETGALSNIGDFRVSGEQSNEGGRLSSSPPPRSLNQPQKTADHTSLPAETITTASTTVSSAPGMVTTLACPGSVAVVTVSHSQPLVTTTPFFIFPGGSSQTSITSLTSEQVGERGFLPYPAVSTATVSFPSLLPPAVPLAVPKVPDIPVQNTFPYHQSMTSIIPPASSLFQLCPQNQEATVPLLQGNNPPNILPEAANPEVSLFSVQTLVNDVSSTRPDNVKTLSLGKDEAGDTMLQLHTLPLTGNFPLLAELSSSSTPVETSTAGCSMVTPAQHYSEPNGGPHPSGIQSNTLHEPTSSVSDCSNSEQDITLGPSGGQDNLLQPYGLPIGHTADQLSPSLEQHQYDKPDQQVAGCADSLLTQDNDTSSVCFSQPITSAGSVSRNSLQHIERENGSCVDTSAVQLDQSLQNIVPQELLLDVSHLDHLALHHPDAGSLPVSVNMDTAESEVDFRTASS